MKLNVLKIKGKKSVFIKSGKLQGKFFLNDIELSDEAKKHDIVINESDKLEFIGTSKILMYYTDGKNKITVDEYRSKPQRYDSDSSEEQTLRAIANRKELEGFSPFYEEPKKEIVEYVINGEIQDTGSSFIKCTINGIYSNTPVVYTVFGREIAIDEYNNLSKKYKDHAIFDVLDRNYLRFAKINNSYAFGECKPFNDFHYMSSFDNLEKAISEENEIRDSVKKIVESKVFNKKATDQKQIQIISNLKMIKKMKTIKCINEFVDSLIKDIEDYSFYVK